MLLEYISDIWEGLVLFVYVCITGVKLWGGRLCEAVGFIFQT